MARIKHRKYWFHRLGRQNLNAHQIRDVEVDWDTTGYDRDKFRAPVGWHWQNELQDTHPQRTDREIRLEKLLGERESPRHDDSPYGGPTNNWFAALRFWQLNFMPTKTMTLIKRRRKKWLRGSARSPRKPQSSHHHASTTLPLSLPNILRVLPLSLLPSSHPAPPACSPLSFFLTLSVSSNPTILPNTCLTSAIHRYFPPLLPLHFFSLPHYLLIPSGSTCRSPRCRGLGSGGRRADHGDRRYANLKRLVGRGMTEPNRTRSRTGSRMRHRLANGRGSLRGGGATTSARSAPRCSRAYLRAPRCGARGA